MKRLFALVVLVSIVLTLGCIGGNVEQPNEVLSSENTQLNEASSLDMNVGVNDLNESDLAEINIISDVGFEDELGDFDFGEVV